MYLILEYVEMQSCIEVFNQVRPSAGPKRRKLPPQISLTRRRRQVELGEELGLAWRLFRDLVLAVRERWLSRNRCGAGRVERSPGAEAGWGGPNPRRRSGSTHTRRK